LVGSALSERLLAAGTRVCGYDVNGARREELAQRGGQSAENARDAVVAADVCLLSLPTSQIVEHVVEELADALTGKTVFDTTTGDPDATQLLSQRLAERGVTYLDATIVGSSKHVQAGDVLLLVGGDEQAFRTWQPLLACFARQVFYLGTAGSGSRMKLVVNLVLGLNRVVLAEGLAFAQGCGVDESSALDVLRAGLAYSRVMDAKGEKMLNRRFQEVEARLSQHHKDVRLILATAERVGLELPLSRLHDQLLTTAEEAGWGAADNSAIRAVYDQPAGNKPRKSPD
jgi:3-hydroxyisobutyrate dehydrogenase-like beta-hydroxyacid dehydrogenase